MNPIFFLRNFSRKLRPLLLIWSGALLLFLLPSSVSAAYTACSVIIPATVTISGNNIPADTTFTAILETEDESSPMPDETQITVTPGEEACFPAITYTEPGEYTYTVRLEAAESSSITTDSDVFTVQIGIYNNGEGGLKAVITYTYASGEKAEEISFTNTYVSPDSNSGSTSGNSSSDSSDSDSEDDSDSDSDSDAEDDSSDDSDSDDDSSTAEAVSSVKTGDTHGTVFWMAIAAAALLMFMFTVKTM